MTTNLPGTDIADVREYIYVDMPRVQNLLAQLEGGRATEQETGKKRSRGLSLGLSRIAANLGSEDNERTVLTMADLYVSMFEEAAEPLGLLNDLSEHVRRATFWKRGAIRRRLQPGMIIRVTAQTRIILPHMITNSIRGFLEAFDDEDDEMRGFMDILDAMHEDALSVSVRPVNDDRTNCAFVGMIPKNHGFAALHNDLTASLLDPDGSELTCLLQISRVPTEHDKNMSMIRSEMDDVMRHVDRDAEHIDREVIQKLLSKVSAYFQEAGFAEAPKWPAISVVPLAIYRHILPLEIRDGEDLDEVDADT